MRCADLTLQRASSHAAAGPSGRAAIQLFRGATRCIQRDAVANSVLSWQGTHAAKSAHPYLRHQAYVAAMSGTASGQTSSYPALPAQPLTPSKADPKTPLQQRILNGILGISNVPYSSYVPAPVTFLHSLDARVKQLWLVVVFLMVARSTPEMRVAMAAGIALVSALVLPWRLWTSQLWRLSLLCGFLFVSTALFADSVPPLLQTRAPPPGLDGLPKLSPTPYHYVIFHFLFITVTHRSVNLATTAAALTFISLQASSLVLVTTPGEEMALGIRWWLSPLRLLRVPVQDVTITLLLSLRFMSLVFEEVRNLALGLAARGVDWRAHGWTGSLAIAGRLSMRLFDNLFHRCSNIAQAMVVRGFQGPEAQRLYMTQISKINWASNVLALALLVALVASGRK